MLHVALVLLSRVRTSGSERRAPFNNAHDELRPSNTSWPVRVQGMWLSVAPRHGIPSSARGVNETWDYGHALKHESVAATALLSQPQHSNCTLAPMRELLHVYTFLPGDDAMLLGHWLRHYVDGLRVRPTHIGFAVMAHHSHGAAWNRHVHVLQRFGVRPERQVTHVNGSYSDELKVATINRFIATTPSDAWVLFAQHSTAA